MFFSAMYFFAMKVLGVSIGLRSLGLLCLGSVCRDDVFLPHSFLGELGFLSSYFGFAFAFLSFFRGVRSFPAVFLSFRFEGIFFLFLFNRSDFPGALLSLCVLLF